MASLDQKTFNNLRRLYIIALSLIALSVLISQVLVHKFLNSQTTDSTVINIAGRQRMLSQKLTKEAIQLAQYQNALQTSSLKDSLSATREIWYKSHLALQKGSDSLQIPKNNTAAIEALFQKINPYFDAVYNASETLIRSSNSSSIGEGEFALETIQANEGSFLKLMDRIVNQYETEAEAKIERLRTLETLLVSLTLLILLAEFIFIFWPTAKAVRTGMLELITAERKARKMARDADALTESKERLLWESRALNQAMDKTLLFVRTDLNGVILHAGEQFKKLLKQSFFKQNTKLAEIISINEVEKNTFEKILLENKRTGWQGEIRATAPGGRALFLEMSLLPFFKGKENNELLIIFLDVTKRKEAHDEIARLTKSNFEERITHQKTISRQIIENQEQEQNRIAQDLHDGIGQMLTGLKFTLESIDLKDKEKAQLKINNLKSLSLDIIKGIRTATFNLTPPELTDHGLIPALTKLCKELSNLTGKVIQLQNKTDFNLRLDTLVEINTYRITQEAINNAIKYADSKFILISIRHSINLLSITIDDDGKGFDMDKTRDKRRVDGGMGMTFMQERMNYINGRLFVNSELGKGTRITLNIPID
ncbi:type IV pili methyl-accepting chemotaxis transducer N-terminal domain-containing protein [Leeuwenhoekiella marinoflava]|uniref:sensor histidine kinase n=1 Tax=Leeuwenhoekiella marinoflava TaxID=988 RepID=UPI0030038962